LHVPLAARGAGTAKSALIRHSPGRERCATSIHALTRFLAEPTRFRPIDSRPLRAGAGRRHRTSRLLPEAEFVFPDICSTPTSPSSTICSPRFSTSVSIRREPRRHSAAALSLFSPSEPPPRRGLGPCSNRFCCAATLSYNLHSMLFRFLCGMPGPGGVAKPPRLGDGRRIGLRCAAGVRRESAPRRLVLSRDGLQGSRTLAFALYPIAVPSRS